MGKIERLFILIFITILLTLFLISSTDLILQEDKEEVYRISVIIDDEDDSYWTNFQKGMNQAVKRWNVDISFITLYEDDLEKSQIDMIQREINNGAQAVIISPVNHQQLEEYLTANTISIPIISVKESINSDKVTSTISVNNNQTGVTMGEAILKEFTKEDKVIKAIAHAGNKEGVVDYYIGLDNALTDYGYKVNYCEWSTKEDLQKIIKEHKGILVGMDTLTSENIITISEEMDLWDINLCANGYSAKILKYLEKNKIKILTVSNDYDMGYMSVDIAVGAINNQLVDAKYQVNTYCIRSEEIFDKSYSMILFPIS